MRKNRSLIIFGLFISVFALPQAWSSGGKKEIKLAPAPRKAEDTTTTTDPRHESIAQLSAKAMADVKKLSSADYGVTVNLWLTQHHGLDAVVRSCIQSSKEQVVNMAIEVVTVLDAEGNHLRTEAVTPNTSSECIAKHLRQIPGPWPKPPHAPYYGLFTVVGRKYYP